MSIPFLVYILSGEGFFRYIVWADSYDDARIIATKHFEVDDIDDIEEFSTFEHGDTSDYKELT